MIRSFIIKLLIAAVTIWNLQAALSLLKDPIGQMPNFLLGGQVGVIVLSSIGVLFLMWNVPYLFSIFRAGDWKILLPVIMTMQFVGLLGEIWIFPLSVGLDPIRNMLTRFIWFDSIGLFLLLLAYLLYRRQKEG